MVDDETRDLRAQQQQRAADEEWLASQSDVSSETEAHRRRADKARYLDEKLEDRARSEET